MKNNNLAPKINQTFMFRIENQASRQSRTFLSSWLKKLKASTFCGTRFHHSFTHSTKPQFALFQDIYPHRTPFVCHSSFFSKLKSLISFTYTVSSGSSEPLSNEPVKSTSVILKSGIPCWFLGRVRSNFCEFTVHIANRRFSLPY